MASEAGISPEKFGQLSYRDLDNHLKGYRASEVQKWKRARLTAYMVYATHASEPESITSWMPLDGETIKAAKLLSKKDYQKLKANWD